ncbi:MAG TPA: threonine ammonia-lyase, partial [Dehalococcoidia bacterium]|nr:threonine ammonia-lyase [Dehalococcoidia bacterium]
ERARGVVAASAGNHAQGVAIAARAYGAKATIVMPVTTPLAKVEATRDYGAEVILDGESYDAAFARARAIADERGAQLIHAYDDPLIVAGQGTVAVEIYEDARDVDVLLVPVGGGGLAAGIGIAARAYWPHAAIIGVQVEAAQGVRRSLDGGSIATQPPRPTIAEGVAVSGPGEVTFPILQRVLDDVVIVDEDDIAQAMVLLMERSKLVVEGAGALGAAAILSNKIDVRGKKVIAVLSGGNVDINMIARVVEHGLMQAGRYYELSVGLDDKPGQLSLLSKLISDAGANVLIVDHHRFGIALPVGRVQVELLLEVRNRAHAADVDRALMAHGFAPHDGEPRFVPAGWFEESD